MIYVDWWGSQTSTEAAIDEGRLEGPSVCRHVGRNIATRDGAHGVVSKGPVGAGSNSEDRQNQGQRTRLGSKEETFRPWIREGDRWSQ